jgi:hypothetical protein
MHERFSVVVGTDGWVPCRSTPRHVHIVGRKILGFETISSFEVLKIVTDSDGLWFNDGLFACPSFHWQPMMFWSEMGKLGFEDMQ